MSRAQREDKTLAKARALNNQLYSDVRSISKRKMSHFKRELKKLCGLRGYQPQYTEEWMGHRYRLYLTLEWLRPLITSEERELNVLEMGGESVVTDLLHQYFPQVRWHNTEGDMRSRWKMDDQSVDLVVCSEVLEHLSDLPEGIQDAFRKTGLRLVLKEIYRVLKTGGFLFVTTPNVASVLQLRSILAGYTPWHFELHVREYTTHDLWAELTNAGFTIERYRTVHCLSIDKKIDYTPIFKMLLDYHFITTDRGDDIFLIARRVDGEGGL